MPPMQTTAHAKCWLSRNVLANTSASQSSMTTQPYQQGGGPQPQPYRLAGNQIFFSTGAFISDRPHGGRPPGPMALWPAP